MRRAAVTAALAAALALMVAATGCGRSIPAHRLTVFAAASLTRPLQGDTGNRYSFAGSQQLVAQIKAGAPADIVITADRQTMDGLAGLTTEPGLLARNQMAIAVQEGNPKHVRGLADLARPDLVVVLADPAVPAGRYAQQILAKAGVAVKPASLELDVEAALQKVVLGQADAAIVYKSDAFSGHVGEVDLDIAQNVQTQYWAAVLKRSKHKDEARRLLSDIRQRLTAAGFDV